MVKLLAATPQTTVDALLKEPDRRRLEQMVSVTWRTDLNRFTSEAEYFKAIEQARPEILMTGWNSPLLTMGILQGNPQLKYMVNLTGELKRYVQRLCIEQGLLVTNWGDIPAASVAEAALMMILASLRRVCYWQIEMHNRKSWKTDGKLAPQWTPEGLFDKTVGLYGFGAIARALVPMLKPFSNRVLVYTSWISEEEIKTCNIERVNSLKELFEKSHIVSIHTGKRPDTYHSVNAEVLSAMRDGGHIINTARGAIIDADALVAELKRGRLFAALDVFEEEEGPLERLPEEHPFRGLPNCLLFPHHGGPTHDYRYRCGAHAVDQVQRYLKGEPLKYVITLNQYDHMT